MADHQVASPVNPADHDGSRPNPDPTPLTTEQLLREISHVENLHEAQLDGLRSLILEKLANADGDIDLAEVQRLVAGGAEEVVKRLDQRLAMQDKAVENALIALQRETIANLDSIRERFGMQESLQTERVAQLRRETDEVRSQAEKQFQVLGDLKANELVQRERTESLRREATALREAQDAAISKSEVASEKRFEGVNEFRAQLADQAATFVSRLEVDAKLEAAAEKIAGTSDRVNSLDLRAKDALSIAAFQSYADRQDQIARDNTRQRAAVALGVALAIFSGLLSVILTFVR